MRMTLCCSVFLAFLFSTHAFAWNAVDGVIDSPLHQAIRKKDLPAILSLLNQGQDPNLFIRVEYVQSRDDPDSSSGIDHEYGLSPLCYAVKYKSDISVIKKLLEKGASPNLRCYWPTYNSDPERTNWGGKYGDLPIGRALSKAGGNYELVLEFLNHGAVLDEAISTLGVGVTNSITSILDGAIGIVQNEWMLTETPEQITSRKNIVQLLLRNNVDPNFGFPLITAAIRGDRVIEITKILLEAGSSLKRRSIDAPCDWVFPKSNPLTDQLFRSYGGCGGSFSTPQSNCAIVGSTYTTSTGSIFKCIEHQPLGLSWMAPDGTIWSNDQGYFDNVSAVDACRRINAKLPEKTQYTQLKNYFALTQWGNFSEQGLIDLAHIFPDMLDEDFSYKLYWYSPYGGFQSRSGDLNFDYSGEPNALLGARCVINR